MSASVRAPADDRHIELGNATNWRLIVVAAGLGLVVLIAVVVLGLAAAAPRQEPLAQTTVVPAPDLDTLLPAPSELRTQPREAQPQPAVMVAISKPALSKKPKASSKPALVVSNQVPQPVIVVESTPESAKPTPVVQKTPTQSFKRYSPFGEEDLRGRLYQEARELDVDTEKGTTTKLLAKSADKPQVRTTSILELIAKRTDLTGLPVRAVDKCQVPAKEAKLMAEMSVTTRAITAELPRTGSNSSYGTRQKYLAYVEKHLKKIEWRDDLGVRMMMQMLQVEDEDIRMKMIEALAGNKDKNSTAALARLAVFDLDSELRLAAITALQKRPAAEVRPVLMEALRYVWAPVADHAAEALVALNDQEAVLDLVGLLDKPDPEAPFQNKDKKWVAAELVRVNHLGNCVLCHAPSSDKKDTVRGLVPERGKPLPVVYYESEKGNFVRADVTYLKQDFSIMQLVPEPGKWPEVQRFDYLVRQRELSADEVKRLTQAEKIETPKYPQREAVLWALRELTGKNIGARSADWNQYIKSMKIERMKCDP